MTLTQKILTPAALAFVCSLPVMSSCSSVTTEGPTFQCSAANGVWTVQLEYSSGLTATQQWTIIQTGCDLSITGNPADTYGPSLTTAPANGSIVNNSFWASWVNAPNECQYSSSLDSTMTGSTFSGSIFWFRNGHGAGYCPASYGTITIIGVI